MELRDEVQALVRGALHGLESLENSKNFAASLRKLCDLLPRSEGLTYDRSHCHSPIHGTSQEFMQRHYYKTLETIVNYFSVEWIHALNKEPTAVDLLNRLFFHGYPHDALVVLSEGLHSSGPSYKRNRCVQILETLIKNYLADLLGQQCEVSGNAHIKHMWPQVLVHIATLPDRAVNSLKGETSAIFYPAEYIPLVVTQLLHALNRVHSALKAEQDCSVEFLGLLIGKLSVNGHGELLWKHLMPPLEDRIRADLIWSRICLRLIYHVPSQSLESVLTPLLMAASWYGTVKHFLGSSVLDNSKMNFLLVHKLLLVRHFSQAKFLQNLVGYLASSTTTRPLFQKMLLSVLEVWGDASALKHTSYEQHLYISKVVIVSMAFLQDQDKESKSELLQRLMSGMQCHLDSPISRVRSLGMVVAECVTQKLEPQGQPLKFEYSDCEETKYLKSLLIPPCDPAVVQVTESISALNTADFPIEAEGEETGTELNRTSATTHPISDLDSDDDLEPFDLSHDTTVAKVKVPVYLRECMEGLINNKDPDTTEVCLVNAEKIIRSHSSSAREIAAEFVKVLLHLSDNFCLTGFQLTRHRAMVSLAVVAPLEVSAFLTQEIYSRNYNLRQRMDILEVLTNAAQELSSPGDSDNAAKEQKSGSNTGLIQELREDNSAVNSEPECWQAIVQKRIDSKTRRFAHSTKLPASGKPNKFAAVAGHFFFPLLQHFDRPENTLDLLEGDYLLLSRLVYSLGVILHAALHAPVVRHMAKSMLNFSWALRFHPQPAVRQALLFAVAMVILSTPSHVLVADLQDEMAETRGWLQDVVDHDTDDECKKLALQNLVLLQNSIKKEFESNASPGS